MGVLLMILFFNEINNKTKILQQILDTGIESLTTGITFVIIFIDTILV